MVEERQGSEIKVAIFGPGAIGGYLGLCLSAGGLSVRLIGRANSSSAPLRLRSARTASGHPIAPPHALVESRDPKAAAECDAVLVAVKSRDTAQVAALLADVLRPDALVISFQNGLTNYETLRLKLGERVAAAVVGFNVVSDAECRYQTTPGKLYIEDVKHPAQGQLAAAFSQAKQSVVFTEAIRNIVCGKLLINLHNGISAATGLDTRSTLMSASARYCYAQCLREGLSILRASGESPKSPLGMPLSLLPLALSLPSGLIRLGARRMLPAGTQAKSSTLVDVLAGKANEVDDLNGEIVRRAAALGRGAPVNDTVCQMVHRAEKERPPRFCTSHELQEKIEQAIRRAQN